MKTGCYVHDVMTREVVVSDSSISVYEAAKLMAKHEVGSIVVTDGDNPIGIVTEQDVARNVVAKGKDPKSTLVKDVIGKRLMSIKSNKDIYDAAVLMKVSEIKHLPVIDEGVLMGILTAKDIIRTEPYLIEMLQFKSSMSKQEVKDLFKGL